MNEGFFADIDRLLSGLAEANITPISFTNFSFSLAVSVVIGLMLFGLYNKSPVVRNGDVRFSALLVLVVLITATIITFIKSSLVLSIGLVGALSIVRFRTPIKDPVDLGFLFASIAFGIGVGASQIRFTLFAAVAFVATVFVLGYFIKRNDGYKSYFVNVSGVSTLDSMAELAGALAETFGRASVVRADPNGSGHWDVYLEVLSVNSSRDVLGQFAVVNKRFPEYRFEIIRSQV